MIDRDISRLMGFLLGDGWCSYNKKGEYYEVGFQQSFANRTIYHYYRNLILKYHRGYFRERIRNHKLELIIYNKQIYQLILDLKKNPITYFRSSIKEQFVAGFTDAEGYISTTEIAIYNNHKNLLNEIMQYLQELNIHCRIRPMKHIWRLRIRGSQNIRSFMAMIPTLKTP